MYFPPPSQTLESTTSTKRKHIDSCSEASKSQSLDISSKKKGNHGNCNSAASKRSRSGSNQPTADQTVEGDKKRKGKRKKKAVAKKITKTKQPQLDSPAMATRSKIVNPACSAMSTRSKRRLSLRL
ncbi:hypothetical protein GQ55_8G122500 [Panicum hallii var. hallii]|uniref:Uncharacterized protein n=1 Tax=Panicum hallii var. hallii TaxID=1504633 RepID=A0A2T7CMR1_9POAL|nr:hypothetical protein GQ55_8G122500 [Panicum hallii var. hallii]